MTEQQLLLLGFLFVVGFVVVYAVFSGIEHHRTNTTDRKESTSSQDHERAESKAEEPEQDAHYQERKVPWYEVLGVEENAPLKVIQQAYRSQISQYHPDKIAGMAEELRKLANLRTVEINEAYEFAKKRSNGR